MHSCLTMIGIHGWYFTLLWFKIKLALVILLFVNGFTLGRTSTTRLQNWLKNPQDPQVDTGMIQRSLKTFQTIQLTIFIIIILLTAFRFY